jgi:hypothetical protein
MSLNFFVLLLVGKPILQAKWSGEKFYKEVERKQTKEKRKISRKKENPKPGHTQEDTHYSEWYPDTEGYPLHWVIPITDTPKRIPITLSDTLTLSDTHYTEWYRYPEWLFLSPKVLTTHPRVYPLHWGTLFSSQTNQTLSDTHHTEWFFLTRSDTHHTEWFFLTRSDTHHTEWFFLTLSDTHYPEFSSQ